LAGGWKNLYAQKHVSEKRNKPWVVPSDPEIEAILELVRGDSSLDRVGKAARSTISYLCRED